MVHATILSTQVTWICLFDDWKSSNIFSQNDDLMVIYHGTQQEINEKTIMNESKVMNDQ